MSSIRCSTTPTCLLLIGNRLSLTSRRSHYAGSRREIRHEIECFCGTTDDGHACVDVLVALINEWPVLEVGVGALRGSGTLSVSASDFEFISENSQIATVGIDILGSPKSKLGLLPGNTFP